MAAEPEAQARAEIDRLLGLAGWGVRDPKQANIHPHLGAGDARDFSTNLATDATGVSYDPDSDILRVCSMPPVVNGFRRYFAAVR
jgi:hypothetical protein